MSNHSGSYLLNEMITILDREQVFTWLGQEKSQQLMLAILRRACDRYDCNSGEILEGHTALFGLCYGCFSSTDDLEDGLCQKCKEL